MTVSWVFLPIIWIYSYEIFEFIYYLSYIEHSSNIFSNWFISISSSLDIYIYIYIAHKSWYAIKLNYQTKFDMRTYERIWSLVIFTAFYNNNNNYYYYYCFYFALLQLSFTVTTTTFTFTSTTTSSSTLEDFYFYFLPFYYN